MKTIQSVMSGMFRNRRCLLLLVLMLPAIGFASIADNESYTILQGQQGAAQGLYTTSSHTQSARCVSSHGSLWVGQPVVGSFGQTEAAASPFSVGTGVAVQVRLSAIGSEVPFADAASANEFVPTIRRANPNDNIGDPGAPVGDVPMCLMAALALVYALRRRIYHPEFQ